MNFPGWRLGTREERTFYFGAVFGFLGLFDGLLTSGLLGPGSLLLMTSGSGFAWIALAAGLWGLFAFGLRSFAWKLATGTNSPWKSAFLGYALFAAIPLLAAADAPALFAVLLAAEGAGRALRRAVRERLLPSGEAEKDILGRRLHRKMTAAGFIAGACFLGLILFLETSKGADLAEALKAGLAFLWLPALLAVLGLGIAYRIAGRPPEGNSGNSAP